VRTAHGDVERPIREALVNEVVRRDDGGGVPEVDSVTTRR
jgi:hypothetical protein